MKKKYIKIEYKHQIPGSYNARIAFPQFNKMEERRRVIYEWLNKTNAPKEVWDAYESSRRIEVWVT